MQQTWLNDYNCCLKTTEFNKQIKHEKVLLMCLQNLINFIW